ncbi:hypothetical protein J6590_022741 [Homalodisca vitripennis]|nr:hypothetical protein J6590_022741 [Homalodisca vitripennis]
MSLVPIGFISTSLLLLYYVPRGSPPYLTHPLTRVSTLNFPGDNIRRPFHVAVKHYPPHCTDDTVFPETILEGPFMSQKALSCRRSLPSHNTGLERNVRYCVPGDNIRRPFHVAGRSRLNTIHHCTDDTVFPETILEGPFMSQQTSIKDPLVGPSLAINYDRLTLTVSIIVVHKYRGGGGGGTDSLGEMIQLSALAWLLGYPSIRELIVCELVQTHALSPSPSPAAVSYSIMDYFDSLSGIWGCSLQLSFNSDISTPL